MIQDVLVHVDGSSAGRERLKYALALADRHGSRLTGAHVLAPVDVPPYYRPSAVDREGAILAQDASRDARAADELFHELTGHCTRPVRWRSLQGGMGRQLCEQAAFADVVVIGQYEAEGAAERHPLTLADDLVLNSGRPVLVVPEEAREAATIGRALIGWDGSREAVRAVHDAIPLLRAEGAAIEVLVADEHLDSPRTSDLIDHLARHGIPVDASRHVHSKAAESALLQRLEAREFDLLVIGAYGHPVWLEFLFGGTTHSVFTQAKTPIFASH